MLSKAIERVRMTVETPEVAPTVPTLKLLSHRTCFFQEKGSVLTTCRDGVIIFMTRLRVIKGTVRNLPRPESPNPKKYVSLFVQKTTKSEPFA